MNEKNDIMGKRVKDCMETTFTILPESLPPLEASSELPAGNYGVVRDSKGLPVALVAPDDLERAADRSVPVLKDPSSGLPPTIIIDSEVEIRTLIQSEALTLFSVGARGAVVMENREVVGILPADIISKCIRKSELPATKSSKGIPGIVDTELPGPIIPRLGRIHCSVCGFTNMVSFIDEENLPQCQNPAKPSHTLVLL